MQGNVEFSSFNAISITFIFWIIPYQNMFYNLSPECKHTSSYGIQPKKKKMEKTIV